MTFPYGPTSNPSLYQFHLFCAECWATGACVRNTSYYVNRRHRGALLLAFRSRSAVSRADTAIDANANVMRALADAGISRRVGSANMRGTRLKQIAALLYPHSQIVSDGTSESRTKAEVAKPETGIRVVLDALSDNDAVRSSFVVPITLFNAWF